MHMKLLLYDSSKMKIKNRISIFYFVFLFECSTSLRSKIIGGKDAKIKNIPYQASLRFQNRHFCGGAIISARHILTAAHCITKYVAAPYNYVSVSTGTNELRSNMYSQPIAKITIHPGWTNTKESSFLNDIAIITLPRKMHFDNLQQKVELASHDIVSGTKAQVTGWGHASAKNGEFARKLQKLQLTLLNNTDCQKYHRLPIYKQQLCALRPKRRGSCYGDSGSPVVINNQVIGIVSWVSDGDCASEIPEVYTNVYAYNDFIQSVIQN